MNKVFIDNNICIYAFDRTDKLKQEKAFSLLGSTPWISSQVMIETYNACFRKLKLSHDVCEENLLILSDITSFFKIDIQTIHNAFHFKRKYSFSFLDALIVASAFQVHSSTLYSEDLQHDQLIENKLRVINPFI